MSHQAGGMSRKLLIPKPDASKQISRSKKWSNTNALTAEK